MGSVLLPLAKRSLKKLPSLIDFILSSRQALQQYVTSSPWGLAAACLAARRSRDRACHCHRSDAAIYRQFGPAVGTGSESEERWAAVALQTCPLLLVPIPAGLTPCW